MNNWLYPEITHWTTRAGERIAISDLSDSHLTNILRMLERAAPHAFAETVTSGYMVLSMLQGEAAIDSVESDLFYLEQEGDNPSILFPEYDTLFDEYMQRGLPIDDIAPPNQEGREG